MKIQKITDTYGNNFRADMECEYCGNIQKLTTGYNDGYYHNNVIPAMTCTACGKNRAGVVPEQSNDNGQVSV